jgi:Tol biopolymer transport system component
MGRRVQLVVLGGIAGALGLTGISSESRAALSISGSALKGTIAFASFSRAPNGIYLMRADGTHVRALEQDRQGDVEPAWSRDGTRIAFTRLDGDGYHSIYVVNADGKRATASDQAHWRGGRR